MFRGIQKSQQPTGTQSVKPNIHATRHTLAVEGDITSCSVFVKGHGMTKYQPIEDGSDISEGTAPLYFEGGVESVKVVPNDENINFVFTVTSHD